MDFQNEFILQIPSKSGAASSSLIKASSSSSAQTGFSQPPLPACAAGSRGGASKFASSRPNTEQLLVHKISSGGGGAACEPAAAIGSKKPSLGSTAETKGGGGGECSAAATGLVNYVPMKTVEYACLITSSYILMFMVFFVFTWVILYSFNPWFVRVTIEDEIYTRPDACPDPVKCALISALISFFALVLIWIVTRDW